METAQLIGFWIGRVIGVILVAGVVALVFRTKKTTRQVSLCIFSVTAIMVIIAIIYANR